MQKIYFAELEGDTFFNQNNEYESIDTLITGYVLFDNYEDLHYFQYHEPCYCGLGEIGNTIEELSTFINDCIENKQNVYSYSQFKKQFPNRPVLNDIDALEDEIQLLQDELECQKM